MKKELSKIILIVLSILLMHVTIYAAPIETGYDIKVKLTSYNNDTLLLGYQLGSQSYIKDTALIDKKTGTYTFKGEKKLEPGIYIVVMRPDNSFFQIVVNDDEQNFSLDTDAKEYYTNAKTRNSIDNQVFVDYMNYLGVKRKQSEEIAKLRKIDSVGMVKKLALLDEEVKAHQQELIKKYPKSLTIMLMKAATEVDMPKFDEIKDKDKKSMTEYIFYKHHYFDNYDMTNPAILRTPVLYPRINNYLEKLTPQHPDSIIESLERVFTLLKPNKPAFQFYFIEYLNKYIKSNVVGYDAIHVYLTKKYIESGYCDDFIPKDNKAKLVDNANAIFPTLIGKKAPNIRTFQVDSTPIFLHEIKAKYTILFFFAPDCSHCQKQSPHLVEFFKKVKENNWDIKVVTVCTFKGNDKMPECWKYAKEKGFDGFINTVDPYVTSHYSSLYNVVTTPQLFILDENKIIRSKSVATDQLTEVFDFIMKEDAEKIKKESGK